MRQWQSAISGRYGFELEDDEGIPTLRMHTMTWFPRQFPYLNYWLWVRNGLTLYQEYTERFGIPDIVHAHAMIYGGLLAGNIQTRYGIPFVITEHGTAYKRNLFAPWELKLAAKAAAAANARLAVSEAFCQELNQFIGSQWKPCANVVSSSFTTYPLSQAQAHQTQIRQSQLQTTQPQPNQQPFTFTTVAYLSARKGIHHLMKAFAKAFENDDTALLKIGGDGRERERLEALATELNISSRVVFLGALDRQAVREAIAQTDVFVLASHYETFGVVVIEALALGKPVIATRCGGPNLVVREQDGLLIEPENVEAMVQALKQMRDRHSEYDAQAIRRSCIERYGEQALVDRLMPIYKEISGKETSDKETSDKDISGLPKDDSTQSKRPSQSRSDQLAKDLASHA